MTADQGGGHDVLVVDDNPGDRRFIREALRGSRLDVIVHTVTTKDQALDMVNRRGEYADAPEPAAILLDWNLSRETGEEVLEAAKSGDSSTPVLVMTGTRSEINGVKSMLSQADTCIQKPSDPDGYVESLRSLLSGR